MANGEFKTVSATTLNEQQYLPTLKNLMSFKSELLGMSVKLFRFSKLPFKQKHRTNVHVTHKQFLSQKGIKNHG